uniref:Uncharacterized protein n=1 Tax=Cacopsylla melanoneura TaxID=428564 RepID=A0A8D9DYI2_9HEMI
MSYGCCIHTQARPVPSLYYASHICHLIYRFIFVHFFHQSFQVRILIERIINIQRVHIGRFIVDQHCFRFLVRQLLPRCFRFEQLVHEFVEFGLCFRTRHLVRLTRQINDLGFAAGFRVAQMVHPFTQRHHFTISLLHHIASVFL